MIAGFFNTVGYAGPWNSTAWPAPPEGCDREAASLTMHRAMDQVLLADELGFDWVSVSEHHYSPRILTPSPMIFAAAITQKIKRARIAILGPLLPLSNPVRVAEELAMLDVMSDGRIVVLFLRGTPNEVLVYRANPDESREVTQEGIELILRAWTEPQPFGWEGRYFNFRTVSVWPRTRQEPHPRVFSSGNTPDSVPFAAQQRLGLALSFMPLAEIRHRVNLYHEEAAKAGWQPTADDVVYRFFGHVAVTDEQARRNVGDNKVDFGRVFGMSPAVLKRLMGDRTALHSMLMETPFLFGSPSAVVDQIGALREAGVGNMDMAFTWPGISYDEQLRSMECFASRVIPQIRTL
jgi:alkanesulfonate monooxygenase SsuD/methylene tetrahydromethanopterin reductase-like flavin-dependent oxidoreductase (luciferase family)